MIHSPTFYAFVCNFAEVQFSVYSQVSYSLLTWKKELRVVGKYGSIYTKYSRQLRTTKSFIFSVQILKQNIVVNNEESLPMMSQMWLTTLMKYFRTKKAVITKKPLTQWWDTSGVPTHFQCEFSWLT